MKKNLFGILLMIALWQVYSLQVPATIQDFVGIARTSEPVTFGIPLPKGAVRDVTSLKLTDNGGTEVPAQFRALQTWPMEGSIQWVLVDLQANVPSLNKSVYKLVDGAPSVTPRAISVSDLSDKIVVNTGKGEFTVSKTRFNLFDKVVIDADNDGQVNDTIVSPDSMGGARMEDTFGQFYYGAGNTTKVEVEEAGPLRVVVKATGLHANTAGTDRAFYGYRVRFHFYLDKSYVKVIYDLTNHPLVPRGSLAFEDLSVFTKVNLTGARQYIAYGNKKVSGTLTTGSGRIKLYQDSNGSDSNWNYRMSPTAYSAQGMAYFWNRTTFKGYHIETDNAVTDSGNQALGWVDLSDSKMGLSIAVRKFWQLYPKGIEISDSGIVRLALLPKEYAGHFFLEDMSESNTEIFYYFHGAVTAAVETQAKSLLHPLFGVCSRNWYADSRALPMTGALVPSRLATPTLRDSLVTPIQLAFNYDTSRHYPSYYGWCLNTAVNGNDINGSGFEGPVFDRFTDMMRNEFLGARNGGSTWMGPQYFWAGVDYTLHWIHNRTGNFNPGFELDKVVTSRAQASAYFSHNSYPMNGSRKAIDPVHTLSDLPVDNSGYSTHNWLFMDNEHCDQDHVNLYYYLTGDMHCLEYANSAAEMLYDYILDERQASPDSTRVSIVRTVGWDMYSQLCMWDLTKKPKHFDWATEWLYKHIMPAQDKNQGYIRSGGSAWQYAVVTLGLAKMYEVSGNEDAFDIVNGIMDYLTFFASSPSGRLPNAYSDYDTLWTTNHRPTGNPAGLSSSYERMYYPFAWMYEFTGEKLYRSITDTNWHFNNPSNNYPEASLTGGTLGGWKQLYMMQRYYLTNRDTVPPAAVTDLAIVDTPYTDAVTLEWTVPADNNGPLMKYQVKFGAKPMVEQIAFPADSGTKMNFWAAVNSPDEPVPAAAGTKQRMTVYGLTPNSTVYLGLRSFDQTHNRSGISNMVSLQTGAATGITAAESPALKDGESECVVYPMPFNPRTTISIRDGRRLSRLAPASRVWDVRVYDVKGRMIENLGPLHSSAGSTTSFVWDASRHGSGLYVIKVSGNGYSWFKKALLVR